MLVSQSLSWTVKSFHSIPVSESEKSESESHIAYYKGQRLTLAASLHEYSQLVEDLTTHLTHTIDHTLSATIVKTYCT